MSERPIEPYDRSTPSPSARQCTSGSAHTSSFSSSHQSSSSSSSSLCHHATTLSFATQSRVKSRNPVWNRGKFRRFHRCDIRHVVTLLCCSNTFSRACSNSNLQTVCKRGVHFSLVDQTATGDKVICCQLSLRRTFYSREYKKT